MSKLSYSISVVNTWRARQSEDLRSRQLEGPSSSSEALSSASGSLRSDATNYAVVQDILQSKDYNPLASPVTAKCNFCHKAKCPSYILCTNPKCGIPICGSCASAGVHCGCPLAVARVRQIRDLSGRAEFDKAAKSYSFSPFSMESGQDDVMEDGTVVEELFKRLPYFLQGLLHQPSEMVPFWGRFVYADQCYL